MGLDAWFIDGKGNKIGYFRKFHVLNNILAGEYYEQRKNGDFNCSKLRIGRRIIKKLREYCKKAPKEAYLQEDAFWEEKWEELEEMLNDFDERINNGERIYYHPW